MTVEELIEELNKYDKKSTVFLDTEGYPLKLKSIENEDYTKDFIIEGISENELTITLIS